MYGQSQPEHTYSFCLASDLAPCKACFLGNVGNLASEGGLVVYVLALIYYTVVREKDVARSLFQDPSSIRRILVV